ncbi:MAG: hypothetical protein IKF90_24670 [Parasporobacterium sp.]|nr:hypothetical protein [Parasporobacterium sp.]
MYIYDMECPSCGADGRYLYLDEKTGRFHCEKCHMGADLEKSVIYDPQALSDSMKEMKSFLNKIRPAENVWGA